MTAPNSTTARAVALACQLRDRGFTVHGVEVGPKRIVILTEPAGPGADKAAELDEADRWLRGQDGADKIGGRA
jgi:hypothetical protein